TRAPLRLFSCSISRSDALAVSITEGLIRALYASQFCPNANRPCSSVEGFEIRCAVIPGTLMRRGQYRRNVVSPMLTFRATLRDKGRLGEYVRVLRAVGRKPSVWCCPGAGLWLRSGTRGRTAARGRNQRIRV